MMGIWHSSCMMPVSNRWAISLVNWMKIIFMILVPS